MKKIILLFPFLLSLLYVNAQITSAGSGNWANPATWTGGVVPTAADEVVIAADHDIVLNTNGACRTLTIQTGGTTATNGTLTMNVAGAILTVGDFNSGGGRDSVILRGTLTISNGELNIGGRFRQYASPSQYTQTGGIVRVDGNTGAAGTSVADADFLFRSDRNYSAGFSFTGGTLLFVDPTFGPTSNLLTTNTSGFTYLGVNSNLQLGDGVSTTAGGSSQGFVLNGAAAYVAGNVIINNPSGTNRIVTNTGSIQMSSLNLLAGTLNNTVSVDILGAGTNNGTITQTNDLDFRGGFTNNGSVNASRAFYTLGSVTNNAGASITAPNFYVTGNLVNNGSITANTVFGFARAANNNSTTAQVISGTGTFNTSLARLVVDNNNAAGVTLQRSLVVSSLTLSEGKLFLGANDVTFGSVMNLSGSAIAYVVTNGTGRLRFSNLTTTEVLFPIGTTASYNPVRISNGSGHTFSAGVQAGFTVPPPGTQHVMREWDIDDETGGAVSATVTLQWNATDEDPTFSRSACAVSHYSGGSWKRAGPVGVATGTGPYTRSATGITTFSPFTVSSNLAVLPVTLARFTAVKDGQRTRIYWQTESEINALHYEIERSADGQRYASLATLAARNQGGRDYYEAKDEAPLKGVNFYRLKMVDKDGKMTYSTVAKLDWQSKSNLAVWPNPARETIVVSWDKKPTTLVVTDGTGRTVLQLLPSATGKYNVSGLRAGIYHLQARSEGAVETVRFVKQ